MAKNFEREGPSQSRFAHPFLKLFVAMSSPLAIIVGLFWIWVVSLDMDFKPRVEVRSGIFVAPEHTSPLCRLAQYAGGGVLVAFGSLTGALLIRRVHRERRRRELHSD